MKGKSTRSDRLAAPSSCCLRHEPTTAFALAAVKASCSETIPRVATSVVKRGKSREHATAAPVATKSSVPTSAVVRKPSGSSISLDGRHARELGEDPEADHRV